VGSTQVIAVLAGPGLTDQAARGRLWPAEAMGRGGGSTHCRQRWIRSRRPAASPRRASKALVKVSNWPGAFCMPKLTMY